MYSIRSFKHNLRLALPSFLATLYVLPASMGSILNAQTHDPGSSHLSHWLLTGLLVVAIGAVIVWWRRRK